MWRRHSLSLRKLCKLRGQLLLWSLLCHDWSPYPCLHAHQPDKVILFSLVNKLVITRNNGFHLSALTGFWFDPLTKKLSPSATTSPLRVYQQTIRALGTISRDKATEKVLCLPPISNRLATTIFPPATIYKRHNNLIFVRLCVRWKVNYYKSTWRFF